MQDTDQTKPTEQKPEAPAKPKLWTPTRTIPDEAPPEFTAEKIMTQSPAELIQLLKDPAATVFQKAKACQRLAEAGSKEAVPALAALLSNEQLAHYARYGLEPIPDASADVALREALPKLKGALLVGVINSIGERKDAGAVDALAKLMYDPDGEVALAAAAALGRISGSRAAGILQDGLGKTKGDLRSEVAAAGLVCAEGLMAQGQREEAFALYDRLCRRDMPKSVRLAAMHSTISAETSLSRPR